MDTHDLFRHRLQNMPDQRHELVRFAGIMGRERFDETFGPLYCPDIGFPGKATHPTPTVCVTILPPVSLHSRHAAASYPDTGIAVYRRTRFATTG